MKPGGGEGGGGGGGAAGIGMHPGAPLLVLSARPETLPLPRPPPSPTWSPRCAQAGPAGGREGAGRAEREVRRRPSAAGVRVSERACVSACVRARAAGGGGRGDGAGALGGHPADSAAPDPSPAPPPSGRRPELRGSCFHFISDHVGG